MVINRGRSGRQSDQKAKLCPRKFRKLQRPAEAADGLRVALLRGMNMLIC